MRKRTLGHRMAQARKAVTPKISQHKAGRAVGKSRATIGHYENNRAEPPSDILGRLSKLYRVSTDHLLGLSGDGKSI